ncbi:CvpA family protein [Capnocytophaga sp. ARDL2]|uniref:CvpA family protein n=1 Tax=Capnocytophaga sp. ARDL2 TaxID=3238809 RepID=UPI0035562442
MHFIDIIICCLLGYAMYKGFKKGGISAILTFIALFLGIYVSVKFSFFTQTLLENHTEWKREYLPVFAFALTFIGTILLVFIIEKIAVKTLRTLHMGWLNRLIGATFEGLKMVLLLSVLLNLFEKINLNHFLISKEQINASLFYQPIQDLAMEISPIIKEWYEEFVKTL